MKWKVYKDNRVCYLVMVIYKYLETGERYAHSEEKLNEILQQLCKDESVRDFRVFMRVNVEPEND